MNQYSSNLKNYLAEHPNFVSHLKNFIIIFIADSYLFRLDLASTIIIFYPALLNLYNL